MESSSIPGPSVVDKSSLSNPENPEKLTKPLRKTSSGRVSSPTELMHDLKKLEEDTKLKLSTATNSCYLHIRANGERAAIKDTLEKSPRTVRVKKLLQNRIRLINPINQTVTLTDPIILTPEDALVVTNPDDLTHLDASSLPLFKTYLHNRTNIVDSHTMDDDRETLVSLKDIAPRKEVKTTRSQRLSKSEPVTLAMTN